MLMARRRARGRYLPVLSDLARETGEGVVRFDFPVVVVECVGRVHADVVVVESTRSPAHVAAPCRARASK